MFCSNKVAVGGLLHRLVGVQGTNQAVREMELSVPLPIPDLQGAVTG